MYRVCPQCGSRLIPLDDRGEHWSCPVCEVTITFPDHSAERSDRDVYRGDFVPPLPPDTYLNEGKYQPPFPPSQIPMHPPWPPYPVQPNFNPYTQPPYYPPGYSPYPYPDQHISRDTSRRVSAAGLFLFYIMIAFNVIALCYALIVVPPKIFSEEVRPLFFVIPFPPFLVGIDIYITGYPAVFYFLLLAATIFLSLEILVFREGRSFFHIGKKLLSDSELSDQERKAYDNNGFVLIGELFMATIFFNIAYIILLFTVGIEMESPDFDDWHLWELMYAFARAAVWEEVISRMALIGIPLIGIHAVIRKKGLRPDTGSGPPQIGEGQWYRYIFGGGLEITPITAALIFISSLLFGLAHMGSWDAYKVVPTLVGGMAMGYLFVRKGVHASIIFHFAIDYILVLSDALGSGAGTAVAVITGLILIILFSLGGYMFFKYGVRFHDYTWCLVTGGSVPDGAGTVDHGDHLGASANRGDEMKQNTRVPDGPAEFGRGSDRAGDHGHGGLPAERETRLERPFGEMNEENDDEVEG